MKECNILKLFSNISKGVQNVFIGKTAKGLLKKRRHKRSTLIITSNVYLVFSRHVDSHIKVIKDPHLNLGLLFLGHSSANRPSRVVQNRIIEDRPNNYSR